MGEECGVQVGVRVRPFNQREKDLGAKLCVEMEGPSTILNPPPEVPADGKKIDVKRFTFDASFWSHDNFETDDKGYCYAKPGSNYADQALVFEKFGKMVLDNAWAGYHCCLFAYGQTGAGKSYSMVGYGANRGIVPISCEEIFRRIESNTDPDLKYEVLVSMVEIYNEAVQDLLIVAAKRPKKGLEIRESKELGIFIDGVIKRPVASYKAIEACVDEGTENRTVGSTLMNATSSRAHTVIVIEFKQLSRAGGQTGCKVSLINLVDLAGSEKAGQTGASGDRLKEGCAINKSLSALGNVIEKLADKAEKGKKQAVVIPYRDSKLTRLLQNALGGSSKTVMICAISPASSNHEETLSTLRYADRAKRIKNTAAVNENPADKLIRQLREENAKLRDLVEKGMAGGGPNQQPEANAAVSAETAEEMERKKAEINALESALGEMQKSFAERLAEAKEQAALEAKELAEKEKHKQEQLTLPHIANLNEDQLLTNKLHFSFPPGVVKRIGRAPPGTEHSAEMPEICLAGPGIQQDHCTMQNDGTRCWLTTSEAAAINTFINGQNPKISSEARFQRPETLEIKHGDMLAFGQCFFMFIDPSKGKAEELLASGQISFAAARKQVADGGEARAAEELEELKASRARAEELERLVKEAERAKSKEKANAEKLLKEREEEFRQKMEELQKEWEQSKAEADAKNAAEAQMRQHQADSQAAVVESEEKAKLHAQELESIQREQEARAAQMKEEFEQKQRKVEEGAQQRIKDLEKKAQKAAAEEEDHRQREANMRKLEEQLMIAMPLVKEANLIAVELNRPHRLETKMMVELTGDRARGSIHVSAAVSRDGVRVYEWALETLENRVFLMRELLQSVEDEGPEVAAYLSNEDDPFWDPIEVERQIGVAQASLQGLLMQVENQHDCRILSTEVLGVSRQDSERARAPHQVGTLRVEIWPCGKDGSPGVPDEEVVDEAEELLGSKMTILVQVVKASGLPEELANDVRVEYDFFIDEAPHQVPIVSGYGRDVEMNYRKVFVQDPVTSRFMEYCDKKALVFRIYGQDAAACKLQDEFKAQEAALQGCDEQLAVEAFPPGPEPEALMEELPLEPHPLNSPEEPPGPQPAPAQPPPPGPEPPQVEKVADVPSIAQVRREAEKAKSTTPPEKKSKTCVLL